jgi:hypothetical protein
MRVRFYDIDWDTSNDDGEVPSPQECGLPTTCTLDVENDTDLDEEGADVLSDKYGFCVFGFCYEVHKPASLTPMKGV